MIQGPNTKTFTVRPGDNLLDGTVKAITADSVVFSQDVNDPLSMVKQKEVRKTIRLVHWRTGVRTPFVHVFPVERAQAMAHKASHHTTVRRTVGIAGATVLAALTAGMMPTAAAAPIRLLSASAQGQAVVIEATEPVAYTVGRPDPLTLLVDLREATVADATTKVAPQGIVSGIRLEQTAAPDGIGVARVRITLARAAEYTVKSSRSTIRVELVAATAAAQPTAAAPKPVAATPAASKRETPTSAERGGRAHRTGHGHGDRARAGDAQGHVDGRHDLGRRQADADRRRRIARICRAV